MSTVFTLLAGIVTTPLNRTQLLLPVGAAGGLIVVGVIAWLSIALCAKNHFPRLAGGLRMVILLTIVGGLAIGGAPRIHLQLSAALATLVISITSGLIGLFALEESLFRQHEAEARADGELGMRIAEGCYLVAIAGLFALPLLPAALLHPHSISFVIIRVAPVAGGVVMALSLLERTHTHSAPFARLLQRLGWMGMATQAFILISPTPFTIGWTVGLLLLLVQIFVIHLTQQRMIMAAADIQGVMGQISHDVLSPVHAMSLLTTHLNEVIQKEYADSQLARPAQQLLSIYQRFEHQIDLLVDFTAHHANPSITLSLNCMSPYEIVRRIVEEEAALTPAPITLDLTPPPGVLGRSMEASVVTIWDKRRIEALVANLLTNAVKYGRRNPITVRLWQPDLGHITLDVADEGIGMTPEIRKHIFEPFYRAADAQEQAGHGLGLAMVKLIVDAHGGTIDVASTRGKGTLVRVTLPRDISMREHANTLCQTPI